MKFLERLKPGTEIDGFLVGQRIHAGEMSNAPMIMKVPRDGPNEPSESVISFETEATILPTLSGCHVPRFIAVGDLARTPYLIMERVEGQNLERILDPGPLPPVEVARIGAAIADAVHDLHQQSVIHLDLKPENVILRPDGTAVLIDFGFAHHRGYPDLLAEEKQFTAGSAAYVSPEQILGTREDPRGDIFALGVLLYQMATGKLPFGEPDTDVRNRLWLDPTPPVVHSPTLQPALQEVILRCLEPGAELRYQSSAMVAFDLRMPEQVELTARGTKLRRASLLKQFKRYWTTRRQRLPEAPPGRSPIIMVAVDTTRMNDELQPALREATAKFLSLNNDTG